MGLSLFIIGVQICGNGGHHSALHGVSDVERKDALREYINSVTEDGTVLGTGCPTLNAKMHLENK